jgi:hypothetical protein
MVYNFKDYKFNIFRNNPQLYNSILYLYKETSNYKRSVNFIKQKYNTDIYGISDIGFLAFHEQNIAAYYGVFPIRLTQNNVDFIAAQSGDTLTHPNYQKKGLFTFLAKQTYKLAKEQKIDLIFGFPNKNSLPGFQKNLDWQFHDRIKEIVISVSTLPIAEISSKISFIRKLYAFYTKLLLNKSVINADLVSLEGFNSQTEFLTVKKDLDFFQYKKYSNAKLIQRNGFIIYLKVETHLIIGDVSYFEKSRFPEFISTIKSLATKLMVFKIKFYLSTNHWLFEYLHDKFPCYDNNDIGFCILSNDESFDLKNALFTSADFDTF